MHRSRSRLRAVVVTMAMLLGLLPASIAMAGTTEACAAAPEEVDFTDVDEDGGTFGEFIACVGGYGIVDGFTDGSFGPALDVTRGQAAKFVALFIETATGDPMDTASSNPYSDVDPNGEFGSFILKLTQADIVEGTTPTTFEPQAKLSRGQMSKIVALALEHLGLTLDDSDAGFSDVQQGGVFAEFINNLANAGIVDGYSDNTFRPAETVSRGQLAKFVANSMGTADDANLWDPTALRGPVLTASSTTANAGQTLEVTVTVYNANGETVEGVRVDLFAADGAAPYQNDGTPKYASDVTIDDGSLGGGQGNRTGVSQGTIDNGDPATNANGVITVEVTSSTAQKIALVAWTGDSGDSFDVDTVPGEDRDSLTLTYSQAGAPDAITMTADRSTNTYPYGDDPQLTAQLVDSDGDPVAQSGVQIGWIVTRGGTQVTPGVQEHDGVAITDANGRATFTYPAPSDPNSSADNETTDRIDVWLDADKDEGQDDDENVEGSITLTFDDAPEDTVGPATLKHLGTTNNPSNPDATSKPVNTQHSVQVTVKNIYGDPLQGVVVNFDMSIVNTADGDVTTNASGIATKTWTGPATENKGSESVTARVDTDGDGDATEAAAPVGDGGSKSTSPGSVTVHWVEVADSDGDDTGNGPFGETIVGLILDAKTVDVSGVFYRYTWDANDVYEINGSEVSQSQFQQMMAGVTSNDRLVVDHDQNGESTFNLLTSRSS